MTAKERERMKWAFLESLRDLVGGYIYVNNGKVSEVNSFVIVGKMGTYDISIKKRERKGDEK